MSQEQPGLEPEGPIRCDRLEGAVVRQTHPTQRARWLRHQHPMYGAVVGVELGNKFKIIA